MHVIKNTRNANATHNSFTNINCFKYLFTLLIDNVVHIITKAHVIIQINKTKKYIHSRRDNCKFVHIPQL